MIRLKLIKNIKASIKVKVYSIQDDNGVWLDSEVWKEGNGTYFYPNANVPYSAEQLIELGMKMQKLK